MGVGLLFAMPVAEAAKRKESPDVVEDALAYAQSDRARAVRVLEEAIAQNPGGRDVDLLMVHAGEQRRLAGNPSEAHAWFTKVVSRGIEGPDKEAASLGLALLDAADGVDGRVLSVLQSSPEKDVLATQNADRFLLLAIDAAKASDAKNVTGYAKRAITYAREDAEVSGRINATVAQLAAAPAGTAIEAPLGATGNVLERAEAAYAAGDLDAALKDALKAAESLSGPEQVRAQGLVRTLQSGPPDRNKIVVLLPLTGKYAAVGEQVRDALKFGYASSPRPLVFVDSGGTPETAVAALEKAVATDHAITVVGPLITDETDAVLEAAENLHVPLLSLSQSYEDTTGHHWALQAMYTRVDQIEALLDYAMGPEKNMKGFAVFSPDNTFGTHAVELFKAGVAKRGGTITTEATYSAEEKNLLPFARKLGVREGDIAALRARAKAQGGNPDTVVLPPRLDFDGIFIPESATRTPLACAALAFEEFPMGDFQPTRDSKRIPLLGLSTWNTPSLVASGNEYTRSSIFTDAFATTVVGDADPFVAAYKAAYGRSPSALEAATVDAGKLLAVASRSDADTRTEFRQALLDATITDAVTGATKFDPETLRVSRKMWILTINKTTIDDLGTVTLE
ncbi:MAG: penicillin-binding protein activator [Myxococcota bacterium]